MSGPGFPSRHLLALSALLLLSTFFLIGCTTIRQQTSVSGEINERRSWDRYEVVWVEKATGERIEFAGGGGRIEGERNRETRRVDYTVIGTDAVGTEHRLSVADLTLVNTRVEDDDGWRNLGVVIASVAAIVGAAVFVVVNP